MKRFIISLAAITMALSMPLTSFANVNNSIYFTDVNENHYGWAAEYVDYIAKNGIAQGVGNNKYAPENKIERGDFAILLNREFQFTDAKLITYALKDVKESDYYAQAIANCYAAGVAKDIGLFYPESPIKRIDAMIMTYRALESQNLINGNISTTISMFKDSANISGIEAQMAAGTLYKAGLINGDNNGNLNPDDTMNRAEMAVMISKLDKYVKATKQEMAEKEEQDAIIEQEQNAQKEEQEKENAKNEETKDYLNESLSDGVSLVNGGSTYVEDTSIKATSENALTLENGSTAEIKNSNLSSLGGNGISAGKDTSVKVTGGSVSATNGNAISVLEDAKVVVDTTKVEVDGNKTNYVLVNDGGHLEVLNSEIEAQEGYSAISVSDNSTNKFENATISAKTGVGQSTYMGCIDVVSKNKKPIEITLENTMFNNPTGGAIYVRESDLTVNIKGDNVFNTSALIYSPEKFKETQVKGNDIYLNLSDNAKIQNTRFDLDNKTILNISLKEGCYLGGQIGYDSNSYINLKMEQGSTLDLNSDCYLDAFENGEDLVFKGIEDNGFNIYYNVDNPENDWLFANTYNLPSGGMVIPYSKAEISR